MSETYGPIGRAIKYTDTKFINCVRKRGRASAYDVAEMMGCHWRVARDRMNKIEALGIEHVGKTHVFFVKEESK